MKSLKLKSYCKINLSLNVIKKINNGYHNISSLITFCNLYDEISIRNNKNSGDKIKFFGEFSKGIDNNSNTITKLLKLLRINKLLTNQSFNILIKKNIPHGSGLGGGSSNAATLLNYFNKNKKLNLNKEKINKLSQLIGFDVPICLEKRNTFLTGKNREILRINKNFKLNILIVYPNLICSTQKIYKKNKKKSLIKPKPNFNKKKLINILKNENNDLEKTVIKIYPKIGKIINFIESQKGCYFSRITGSGSACVGTFSTISNAIYAKKLIKEKYPNYWCVVSKTI